MSVLLHPGFHKTGTTFLQEEVFADPRLFRVFWRHEEVDRLVNRPHDLDFDPSAARADVASWGPTPEGLIDVVSSETLCGNMFFGSRESATRARRLRAIFGDAKILFTVRSQSPALRAIYVQYVKMGGAAAPEAFFDERPPVNYVRFDPRAVEFHRLVELYAELFGAAHVLVLPQEMLRRQPQAFLETLCRFCGAPLAAAAISMRDKTDRGVSPPASGLPLLRLANRFRGGAVNPDMRTAMAPLGDGLARLAYRLRWRSLQAAERLDEIVAQRFAGAFASSNGRLQAFCPSDLRALGYEMPTI